MLRVSVPTALFLAGIIALAGQYVAGKLQRPGSSARAEESQPKAPGVAAQLGDANDPKLVKPLPKTDAEWKKALTPQQFEVLRKHGTEPAFTGEYHDSKKPGVYRCAGCGLPLFTSENKFDSGTGWPSFWQPIDGVKSKVIGEKADGSYLMRRVEVHCNRCQGHMGHVFSDGPAPTGMRYCINSVSIKLDDSKSAEAKSSEKK